jgi:hypothetical protein
VHGESYRSYSARVPRFVPRVGLHGGGTAPVPRARRP